HRLRGRGTKRAQRHLRRCGLWAAGGAAADRGSHAGAARRLPGVPPARAVASRAWMLLMPPFRRSRVSTRRPSRALLASAAFASGALSAPASPAPALGRRAARGAAWIAFSFGATQLIAMATNLLLARVLSPQDFGLVAMANLLLAFVGPFHDSGLLPAF